MAPIWETAAFGGGERIENNTLLGLKRDPILKNLMIHWKRNKIVYKNDGYNGTCGRNSLLCDHMIQYNTFQDEHRHIYCIKGNSTVEVGLNLKVICIK